VCKNYKWSGPCRNGSPPNEPAEQATTFGLAINLKTAAPDLAIRQSSLLRADEVIE
jgi:hypothetical protein